MLVVSSVPRVCKKLGIVRGVGGSARFAIADAKGRAFQRGATHVVLGPPELDVEQHLVTIVEATPFECPPPGSYFPAIGYP